MTSMQTKKDSFHFGEKLRLMRERKGYTLKTVAQEAGVSESLVSQIERNKVSPAIDTLLRLADVLDVNLEYLFSEYRKSRPVRIVTTESRRLIEEGDITYEEVAKPEESDGHHSIESYIITIPANSSTTRGSSYGHPGREMGYILEGKAQLQHEESSYDLMQGDSISFAASSPHVLKNIGDTTLKALWVVTPPSRFV